MVRLARIVCSGGRSADSSDERKILAAQLPPEQGFVDLTSIAPDAPAFLSLGSTAVAQAQDILSSPDARPGGSLHIAPTDCRLCAPIDGSLVGKFLCIGLNYVDHCKETGVPEPKEPVVFNKFGSSIIGPNEAIVRDSAVTTKLDYEVELGVIIGQTTPRHTSEFDAMKYVGGYTVVHDVSARDWQLEKNGGQWLLGKCGDGFAPIGPAIVTRMSWKMYTILGYDVESMGTLYRTPLQIKWFSGYQLSSLSCRDS